MKIVIDTNIAYYLGGINPTKKARIDILENELAKYEKKYITELSLAEIFFDNEIDTVKNILNILQTSDFFLKQFFIEEASILPKGNIRLADMNFKDLQANARRQRIVLESEMLYNFSLFLTVILYFILYDNLPNTEDKDILSKYYGTIIHPIEKPLLPDAIRIIEVIYAEIEDISLGDINSALEKQILFPIYYSVTKYCLEKLNITYEKLESEPALLWDKKLNWKNTYIIQNIHDRYQNNIPKKILKKTEYNQMDRAIENSKEELIGTGSNQFPTTVFNNLTVSAYLTPPHRIKKELFTIL